MMDPERVKIFTGNANAPLAREICEFLALPLSAASVKNFADGEIYLQIQENVRGADVFVVQPTCKEVDRNLMELLLMMDALRRASADRITAVLPYYGYARQDRKDKPRVPISAKLVAKLLERAGADRILALDLHAAQIQGFFDVPVDHLFAMPVMIEHMRARQTSNTIVVSPDAGGVERARAFAKRMNVPLAILDKRRDDVNVAEVVHIIGDVEGCECMIVDDLIDTAGTLINGAAALLKAGAKSVTACATHAVLVAPGRRANHEFEYSRSSADQLDPPVGGSPPVPEDPDTVGGLAAGEGHSVDSRGDERQQAVCVKTIGPRMNTDEHG